MPDSPGTIAVRRRLRDSGVETLTYDSAAAIPPADVYVVSTWAPPSMKRLTGALAGPVYALLHDQVEIFYPWGLNYLYRAGYRLLQAPLLRRVERVITVSDWARRWLQDVHGIKDVYAIHNGVDGERFHPADGSVKAELKKSFGLEGFVALLPSRFALEKNQLAALLAVRGLQGVTLALAGGGPLYGSIKRLAEVLRVKNAVFLGRVADMPRLYQAADLLFFPTLGENQSLAVLEAMASGLPVISSPIPAQKELIDDGVEGWLVAPRPGPLAAALRRALADPRQLAEMGDRARRRVEKEHTLDRTARELARVLQS